LDSKPLLLLRVTGFGCINASDNNNNNNNNNNNDDDGGGGGGGGGDGDNKEKINRLPPSLKNTCKLTQH
jgi:hypothetical protein